MENLLVGKILKFHGLKGELKVKSYSKTGNNYFAEGKTIIVNEKEYLIKRVRFHQNAYLLTLDGYEDINLVQHLHSQDVYSTKENDVLADQQYYFTDIIGCKVVVDGQESGYVEDIRENVTQDLLIINKDGVKRMVPYVDAFIGRVDLDERTIEIKPIKGLLDED